MNKIKIYNRAIEFIRESTHPIGICKALVMSICEIDYNKDYCEYLNIHQEPFNTVWKYVFRLVEGKLNDEQEVFKYKPQDRMNILIGLR